jgi:hypothetical protein
MSYELYFARVEFIQNGRIKTKLLLQSDRGQNKSGKNQTEMAGSSGKLLMRVGSKGIEAKTK